MTRNDPRPVPLNTPRGHESAGKVAVTGNGDKVAGLPRDRGVGLGLGSFGGAADHAFGLLLGGIRRSVEPEPFAMVERGETEGASS